ncbi:MAG TPA: nuclear transport factor 2 family protein [Acidimicrobiales bacterium]|nr:nuclear transport factor 2 family protein [Acidimicrobiales bacterium]
MTHPNEELVRRGYKAFSEGDMVTLRSLYATDAVHSSPGSSPLAGEYKGVDNILGFYGELFQRSDGTFKVELESAKSEGENTVVTSHHGTAQRGGKALDQHDTLTFTIADGKVTHITEKHSDQAAYDTFWS